MTALLSPIAVPRRDVRDGDRSRSAAGGGNGGVGWRRGWTALVVSLAARGMLAGLGLLLCWSLLPALIGWESTVVMSGSMSPRIEAGDLVVIRPVEPAALTPQQVLLVDDPDHPGRLRLHRLMSVEGDELVLRGDANGRDDSSPVHVSAVHGVGTVVLPGLGAPLVWWSEGNLPPLLGVLAGLALLAGAARLAVFPGDQPSTQRSEADPAHRVEPVGLRRLRPRLTVVLGTVIFLVVVAAVPAAAAYTATTKNGFAMRTNPYYGCGAAEAANAATRYYPLQETTGPSFTNAGTEGVSSDGTFVGSSLLRQPGPNCSDGPYAVDLNGVDQYMTTPLSTLPDGVTVSFWFRTTTTRGGVLMNFGDAATGPSPFSDREIYLSDAGEVVLAAATSGTSGVLTSIGPGVNDGKWHYVAATFSSAGSALYVDFYTTGLVSSIAARAGVSGYWRFGYEDLSGWTFPRPSSWYFQGSLAHVSIHSTVLSNAALFAEMNAGRATLS